MCLLILHNICIVNTCNIIACYLQLAGIDNGAGLVWWVAKISNVSGLEDNVKRQKRRYIYVTLLQWRVILKARRTAAKYSSILWHRIEPLSSRFELHSRSERCTAYWTAEHTGEHINYDRIIGPYLYRIPWRSGDTHDYERAKNVNQTTLCAVHNLVPENVWHVLQLETHDMTLLGCRSCFSATVCLICSFTQSWLRSRYNDQKT